MSIADRVRGIVLLHTDGDYAGDGAYLMSDLGLDSLDLKMISLDLEVEFGLNYVTNEEVREAETVGGLIELVRGRRI